MLVVTVTPGKAFRILTFCRSIGLGYTSIVLPEGITDSIVGAISLGTTNMGIWDFPACANKLVGRESAIPKAHLAIVFDVAGAITRTSYLRAAKAPHDGELAFSSFTI